MKSPSSTVVSESSTVFLTQILIFASGLGVQSILAWFLEPVGRGEYAVCVLYGFIFGVLFAVGSDRAAQYFVMSKRIQLSEGIVAGVSLALGGAVIAATVGIFGINSELAFFAKAPREAFLLATALIPLTSVATVLQLQLAGRREFRKLAICAAIQASVTFLTLVVMMIWRAGVFTALWSQIAGQASAILCYSLWLGRLVPAWRWAGLRVYQLVLGYGARYYLARLGNLVDMHVGAILLALIATTSEIGLFTAASTLVLKVLMVPQSIESAILPRVAEDARRHMELVNRAVRVTSIITFAVVVALCLLSYPIVYVILSPKFLEAVHLIWVLAPGIFVQACSRIFMTYFRATNRPGIVSWATWLGLTINAVVVFSLYPVAGVTAAAVGMSCGFLAQGLLAGYLYTRLTGQSWRAAFVPNASDLSTVLRFVQRIGGRLSSTGTVK